MPPLPFAWIIPVASNGLHITTLAKGRHFLKLILNKNFPFASYSLKTWILYYELKAWSGPLKTLLTSFPLPPRCTKKKSDMSHLRVYGFSHFLSVIFLPWMSVWLVPLRPLYINFHVSLSRNIYCNPSIPFTWFISLYRICY